MTSAPLSFHDFERAGWEDAGVVAKYHSHLSTVTRQAIEPLLDAAAVGKGALVLDVATGAGYVAHAAARRGADVIGVDFSLAQVQLARETYPGIRFEQADAEALPFESATFDIVLNAFGMCHFPNPDAGLRESFRVLKHGGHVAFTVWDTPEHAVAFDVLYSVIRTHGSMDIGLPAGPNFFLFSDPQQSSKALTDAGFASPTFRQVPQTWRVSNPDEILEVLAEGSVRAAATLRAQSRETIRAIKSALREMAAKYKRGDSFEVPMPAVLATGIKP